MKRRVLLLSGVAWATGIAATAAEPGNSPIGLILIGASWCPFCKAAAQTLFAAAPPAQLPILVASHDAKPIPPFEEFVDARGHPIAAKYLKLPTLVFVHIPTQKVIAEIEGFKNPRSYLVQVKSVLQQAQEAGYA